MKLSRLQRYILINCYLAKGNKIIKRGLFAFYNKFPRQPKIKDINDIVSRSVNLLIKKDLAAGYGSKTAHKWYLKEVRLTPRGRALAKKFLGEQRKLPFKR
ncbi:MAG: hypothetical protein V1892_01110 [bacterium]